MGTGLWEREPAWREGVAVQKKSGEREGVDKIARRKRRTLTFLVLAQEHR
jgi:hypothetical protein